MERVVIRAIRLAKEITNKEEISPAWPTIHPNLRKMITPKSMRMVGTKTPTKVPYPEGLSVFLFLSEYKYIVTPKAVDFWDGLCGRRNGNRMPQYRGGAGKTRSYIRFRSEIRWGENASVLFPRTREDLFANELGACLAAT